MSPRKPIRGRPRLARREVKGVFCLRLTPAEQAAIEKAAKAKGRRPSQWARDVLLEAASLAATAPGAPV